MLTRWCPVRCDGKDKRGRPCRKVHCEAARGSRIRWKCHRCGTWNTVDV